MTSERNGFNLLLVSSTTITHLQCRGGDAVVRPGCTSGLVFNEKKQACDYRVNVPECGAEESNDLPGLLCTILQLIDKYMLECVDREREGRTFRVVFHEIVVVMLFPNSILNILHVSLGFCSDLGVSCLVARHSAGGWFGLLGVLPLCVGSPRADALPAEHRLQCGPVHVRLSCKRAQLLQTCSGGFQMITDPPILTALQGLVSQPAFSLYYEFSTAFLSSHNSGKDIHFYHHIAFYSF